MTIPSLNMQTQLAKLLKIKKIKVNKEQLDFMLANIGSTDGFLRDQIIYTLFARGFIESAFTIAQKQFIVKTLLASNNLFKKIDQKNNDFVFLRSFTALVFTLALSDKSESYLSKTTIDQLAQMATDYLDKENDFRGWVPGKGWAHAMAHGSDFLCAAIQNPRTPISISLKAFSVVSRILDRLTHPFIDDEETRIATILVASLQNKEIDSSTFVTKMTETNDLRWTAFSFDNQTSYYQMSTWIRILQNAFFMMGDQKPTVRKSVEALIQNYNQKMGY